MIRRYLSRHPLPLAFAASAAVSLVVFAPLSLAARLGAWPAGLVVQHVEGPLWSGRLTGVRWKGQSFNTVDAALDPLSWAWGIPRLALRTDGLQATWSGGRVQGLAHATGALALAPSAEWGGLAMTARADDLQLTFADGRCLRAGGSVAVQVDGAALPDGVPGVGGTARCDGADARVGLAPTPPVSGQVDVRGDLRIGADGGYRVTVRVATQDPATTAALVLAGFQPGPGGVSRVVDGTLAR